jgi:hypothetical protein
MFSKNHRSGQITGHDIVAVIAFALALSLPFSIHEYSDMLSKLLPTRWSVDHDVASYQREKIDISRHRQWTTVWPTVVRFDRPAI